MNQEKVLTDTRSFYFRLQYFGMWRSAVWWKCTNVSKETVASLEGHYQRSLPTWTLRQQIVTRRWYIPTRPHAISKFCHSNIHLSACLKTYHSSSFIFSSFFRFLCCKSSLLFLFLLLFLPLMRGNCHCLVETFFDTTKCMKRPRHIELWNYVLLSCRNLPECQLLKVNATAWYYYIITIQSSCSTKAWNSCRSILPWPLQVN